MGKLEFNQESDLNYYAKFALKRVLKHKDNIINSNPYKEESFDESLRSALTHMMTFEINKPVIEHESKAIKYLKKRISVPRDMPLLSARLFRQSLSAVEYPENGPEIDKIPTQHRYDQDPKFFKFNE